MSHENCHHNTEHDSDCSDNADFLRIRDLLSETERQALQPRRAAGWLAEQVLP
jgi:hypothetical protein